MKRIFLFFCVLLLSCDKNGPTESGFTLTDVRFVAGKSYKYAWTHETRDSLGNLLSTLHDTIVVVIEATDDVVDTLVGLVRLRAYSLVDSIGSTIVWYQNNQAACTEVAYQGAGHTPAVLPKEGMSDKGTTASPAHFFFVPLTVQRLLPAVFLVQSDSLIKREDPRIVFKYPLSQGNSWTSFTIPWLQTRQVVGSETLQAAVGVRYCWKIKTDSPMYGNAIEWFDYVDEEGLMLRSLTMKFMRTAPDSPEPIGTVTAVERTELLSISSL